LTPADPEITDGAGGSEVDPAGARTMGHNAFASNVSKTDRLTVHPSAGTEPRRDL